MDLNRTEAAVEGKRFRGIKTTRNTMTVYTTLDGASKAAITTSPTFSHRLMSPSPYTARKHIPVNRKANPIIPASYEYEDAKCSVIGRSPAVIMTFLPIGVMRTAEYTNTANINKLKNLPR